MPTNAIVRGPCQAFRRGARPPVVHLASIVTGPVCLGTLERPRNTAGRVASLTRAIAGWSGGFACHARIVPRGHGTERACEAELKGAEGGDACRPGEGPPRAPGFRRTL